MKVVGIGASAGGITALSSFLQNLPPNTGAAYVIVQHLSPDFKTVLDDLLRKHTSMPLEIIREDTLPEANHVYLLPGDKTPTLTYSTIFNSRLVMGKVGEDSEALRQLIRQHLENAGDTNFKSTRNQNEAMRNQQSENEKIGKLALTVVDCRKKAKQLTEAYKLLDSTD
ncbi:MAG: chemotaxis protein CheB [Bacteroidota bacterium]